MQVEIIVEIENESDHDAADHTGLTAAAYERLVNAINVAGFSIVSVQS